MTNHLLKISKDANPTNSSTPTARCSTTPGIRLLNPLASTTSGSSQQPAQSTFGVGWPTSPTQTSATPSQSTRGDGMVESAARLAGTSSSPARLMAGTTATMLTTLATSGVASRMVAAGAGTSSQLRSQACGPRPPSQASFTRR